MTKAGWHVERLLGRLGYRTVAGIDEVGMGPLAGPVVAAAVVLPGTGPPLPVADSKTLTAPTRARLDDRIRRRAVGVGIGMVEAADVDRLNVHRAGLEAMRRALDDLVQAGAHPDFVVLDGRSLDGAAVPQVAFPKADTFVASVAAASIVAKVERDRIMVALHDEYPDYGFASHMGYGTPAHLAALAMHGPSPIHRRSFAPVALAATGGAIKSRPVTSLAAADRVLEVARLGVVPYDAAVRTLEARVEASAAGAADALFLLEHPPVYTVGRGGDLRHAAGARESGIPVVRSARGGQVTFHGPGQLVAYPVVDLRGHGCDVGAYVGRLEAAVVRALATWGIPGRRQPGHRGVWVGQRKIASIGIAIRRWIAWHGLALNVGPDVAPFERIVPCGIDGLRMTSVALEGGPDSTATVGEVLLRAFVEEFGYARMAALGASPPEARA